ncbi:MAG: type II toxin-antitoxin system prevent-host-death family antitoxin [Rhodospirillales bacterium]|nr:type II toxin-antitoxin system prevent-host-death family antitoxin [Alphaproteobacteria bacterium]MCB9986104.1 type II toxin-antitoxin system prevent-host-death family antitoxin [Rhodospirillales bacterium]USO07335.1 MAG: type II toxin-antitoxin system prevent-host-death family antitoxin [Rhodospirillales bacterium]
MINIHAAKTNLSKIIAGLEDGGEPVTIARAGKPVAVLSPATSPKKRRGGQLRGQIILADDFDAPDGRIFGIAP